jgi:hypothetical protein
MIPFFQYATESNIDMGIKTPFKATAPYIDYNNSNFDFVGNINLTFDTQGITNQQTVGVGSGNLSTSGHNGGVIFSTQYNLDALLPPPSA